MSRIVDSQFVEVNKSTAIALDKAAKNAPAGCEAAFAVVKSAFAPANSAYENISEATKQIVEVVKENLSAATSTAVKAAGAAA